MLGRNIYLSFILALLLFLPLIEERAFTEEGKKSPSQLTIKGRKIRVEVARTEDEKARGLMFRESLGKDDGMLFVYDREEFLTFWMKNTPIPLSIAFIDRRGKIVDIQDMEPFSLSTHASTLPAQYALEMNKGWFKRNGIGVGDLVRIPPSFSPH
jgi:uncharacterized membrane protein (UPF0127 family)